MLTMTIALLDAAGPVMRGRVMGVRMLAVYGLPIGLRAGGWLVEQCRLCEHGAGVLRRRPGWRR